MRGRCSAFSGCVLCLSDNRGDWLGGEVPWGGPWTSRLCCRVFFPWERTKVLVEVCHLSNSTEFVPEAGGAGLSAAPSGKGLISPRKAAGGPLCGTQGWCGDEAVGRAEQAVRQDGLLRQRVDSMLYSVVELFIIMAKPQGRRDEEGFVLGLG